MNQPKYLNIGMAIVYFIMVLLSLKTPLLIYGCLIFIGLVVFLKVGGSNEPVSNNEQPEGKQHGLLQSIVRLFSREEEPEREPEREINEEEYAQDIKKGKAFIDQGFSSYELEESLTDKYKDKFIVDWILTQIGGEE